MILQRFDYQCYAVPFKEPFATSRGLEHVREGLIVRLSDDGGRSGYGEAVALTAFGTASIDDLEHALGALGPQLAGRSIEDAQAIVAGSGTGVHHAPVRFALDTALLDLQSRAADQSLSQFIRPGAATFAPLNATISDMTIEGAARAACYAATAGYAALKVKIGAAANPAFEIDRIAAIRDAAGDGIELRIDVNGAWTLDHAVEMARMLGRFDIAYLEQPLPASDVEAMASLRRQTDIPIAADEAASDLAAVETLIQAEAADAIIVKPAIAGGVSAARTVIDLALEHGIRVVVTTALETGTGIAAALHLAATLPEPIPPCGLATGLLLETDLLAEPLEISGGRMRVPEGSGLGVEPILANWN